MFLGDVTAQLHEAVRSCRWGAGQRGVCERVGRAGAVFSAQRAYRMAAEVDAAAMRRACGYCFDSQPAHWLSASCLEWISAMSAGTAPGAVTSACFTARCTSAHSATLEV